MAASEEDETGLPVLVESYSVELPVDPTTMDASAKAVLRAVDTRGLLPAALQATDIDADGSWERDRLIAELSPVEHERLADQVRYAAPQTTHYFRLSGLEQVSAPMFDDLVDGSSYGVQLRAVDELFERTYLVFSVPDGGAQSQLSVSEGDRHTTVATFDSGFDVLAVRAPTPESAAATSGKLVGIGSIDSAKRLDFLEPEFLASLESSLVQGYHQLTLGVRRPTAHTDQIELSSDEPSAGEDLLQDDVVRSLLDRPDIHRVSGRGVLSPSGTEFDSECRRSTVDIDFASGVIHYRTAPPESTMVSVDRTILSL
jgi:hypothetical protein